ncbi:hypothetical protein [Stutzerimonas stutzeri]|uniref:hypothetical protein n=1 Tax=Stutzerimonas stutzeri TaxID=316 RepID=UPI0015E35583|nr:hypothetical protein [Stutzerimonas stutzeri]MBA1280564.1 hypothetical protein [Stutzerimonas stutzeri]
MELKTQIEVRAAAARLRETAFRDSATQVMVRSEDLRVLLDSVGAETPTASEGGEVAQQLRESEHHVTLLSQALGECIAAARIIRADAALTGPELLVMAKSLKRHIQMQEQAVENSNAVIQFLQNEGRDSAFEFLYCWNQGDFDALRLEWPEAPEEVYIGADQFHPKTIGFDDDDQSQDSIPSLLALDLLKECRHSLAEGLESEGNLEPEYSTEDRELVARLDTFLSDNPVQLGLRTTEPFKGGLGWVVRERRGQDGELRDCIVQAPAVGKMAYGLEVLGDDYTGFGDVEAKLAHCKLIVALANRDDSPRLLEDIQKQLSA